MFGGLYVKQLSELGVDHHGFFARNSRWKTVMSVFIRRPIWQRCSPSR